MRIIWANLEGGLNNRYHIKMTSSLSFVKQIILWSTGESPPVFSEITSDLSKLSGEVHKFSFEIVFSQLKSYLSGVSTMEVSLVIIWPSGKLPFDFQKIAKNLTFFSKKIDKNCHFFQQNCQKIDIFSNKNCQKFSFFSKKLPMAIFLKKKKKILGNFFF